MKAFDYYCGSCNNFIGKFTIETKRDCFVQCYHCKVLCILLPPVEECVGCIFQQRCLGRPAIKIIEVEWLRGPQGGKT
jgi:hypothetical protein